MSRTIVLTLTLSIAAHLGIGWYLNKRDITPDMTMGSLKAPVSVTFSTVSLQQSQPEQQTAEPEPVPESVEPVKKPLPKPVANAEPVLKRQAPTPEKPVVKKDKPPVKKEVVKKPIEKPVKQPVEKPTEAPEKTVAKKEAPAQPVSAQQTALKESQVEGLSSEPVFTDDATIVNQVQPLYPKRYSRRNIEGAVNLELIVDETGHVINITILESSGFGLMDKSAIAAVKQWEFKPEQRNGLNVKSRLHQRVVFQLN